MYKCLLLTILLLCPCVGMAASYMKLEPSASYYQDRFSIKQHYSLASILLKAEQAVKERRLIDAEKLYRSALELAPSQRHYKLAWLDTLSKVDPLQFHHEIQQQIAQYEDWRLVFRLANYHFERQEYKKALEALKLAQPYIEEAPEFFVLLATIEQQLGHHAAAMKIFDRLLAIRPTEGRYWVGSAISAEISGNTDKAQFAYSSALDDPFLSVGLKDYVVRRQAALTEQ